MKLQLAVLKRNAQLDKLPDNKKNFMDTRVPLIPLRSNATTRDTIHTLATHNNHSLTRPGRRTSIHKGEKARHLLNELIQLTSEFPIKYVYNATDHNLRYQMKNANKLSAGMFVLNHVN